MSALLRARCPRCRRGRIFAPWSFSPVSRSTVSLPRMLANCPECGLKYEREEGYFLGAMYISYGLALVVIGTIAVPLWLLANMQLTYAVMVAFILFLPLVPLLTIAARVLWIHLDRTLDPSG